MVTKVKNVDYINRIIERLKPMKPYKVILFGSHAYDTANQDSDIDMLVVIDDDSYPQNYEENMRNYLKVAAILHDIRKEIPIDSIVHTKPMHQRFIELRSIFSKEILKNGKILYERDHERVVESRAG